jgi:hypothetical protein
MQASKFILALALVVCVGEGPRAAGIALAIAPSGSFSSAQQRGERAASRLRDNVGVHRVQWGYSRRCVTDYGVCFLPYPAPVGQICFCRTPYGPVPGIVL